MYTRRQTKILIIGGNDAGLAAAGRAKRRDPDAEVIVLEQSPYAAFASCSLPYFISSRLALGDVRGPDVESIRRERGFDVLLRHRAEVIDLYKRRVVCRDVRHDKERFFDYDKLILATGASPLFPAGILTDAENVFSLRHVHDAIDIKNFVDQKQPRRAVIIGGGYIGLEMAEALSAQGMQSTIVEKEPRLYAEYHEDISGAVHARLTAQGVKVVVGAEMLRLEMLGEKAVRAVLANGSDINADLFIVAAGIKPNIDVAQAAGIPLGTTGAIVVNSHQQTRRMNVYAVGDCCESKSLVTGKPIWSPLAGVASKQGRVAGDHAAGGRVNFPGVLETSFVQVFGYEVGRTGLTAKQARGGKLDANSVVVIQPAKPAHMGDASITVAMLFERVSKRILGVQMIGDEGVGLRLNIAATAITAKMTLHDLAWMDFGYTPVVNSMWDPLQVAAQVGLRR